MNWYVFLAAAGPWLAALAIVVTTEISIRRDKRRQYKKWGWRR